MCPYIYFKLIFNVLLFINDIHYFNKYIIIYYVVKFEKMLFWNVKIG